MVRLLSLALVAMLSSTAAAQPAPKARGALAVFKALHSALDIGVNHDDYNRRLIDTKIRFDQYYERKSATVNEPRSRRRFPQR